MKIREVRPEESRRSLDPGQFSFQSTSELTELAGMIGQERATEAIHSGIEIPDEGIAIPTEGDAGQRQDDVAYLENSANRLVNRQFQELAPKLEQFGREEKAERTEDGSQSSLAMRPCTCTL